MDISHRLTETLTVKRKTGHTVAGDGVRATTVTLSARIERDSGTTISADGTELQYDARVFTASEVKLSDLLYFPEDSAADQNTGRRPISVQQERDLGGSVVFYTTLL